MPVLSLNVFNNLTVKLYLIFTNLIHFNVICTVKIPSDLKILLVLKLLYLIIELSIIFHPFWHYVKFTLKLLLNNFNNSSGFITLIAIAIKFNTNSLLNNYLL